MKLPLLRWTAEPGQPRRLLAMLVAGLPGLGLGMWLTGPEPEAMERLEAEIAQWQTRLQTAPVPAPAGMPPEPAVPNWPAAGDVAALWSGLQQKLQAQGLQVLVMRPQAVTVVRGLPEQTVALRLQGRWDDWLAVERALAAHVPWWVMDQWQVVPAGTAAAQVQIELQARLGLLPPALQGASPAVWMWPTWAVDQALDGGTVPLFGVDPVPPVTGAGAGGTAASKAADSLPADPRQWPVRELRLLGVWQQAGVAHAVLGAGLNRVVVSAGQSVGREGWRVRRVAPDRVELGAVGSAAVLHLTLQGDTP